MWRGRRFVPTGCGSVGDKNKDSSLQEPFCGLARRNRGVEGGEESIYVCTYPLTHIGLLRAIVWQSCEKNNEA